MDLHQGSPSATLAQVFCIQLSRIWTDGDVCGANGTQASSLFCTEFRWCCGQCWCACVGMYMFVIS